MKNEKAQTACVCAGLSVVLLVLAALAATESIGLAIFIIIFGVCLAVYGIASLFNVTETAKKEKKRLSQTKQQSAHPKAQPISRPSVSVLNYRRASTAAYVATEQPYRRSPAAAGGLSVFGIDKRYSLDITTYVAFDVETTGLDPEIDRITEVAAIRYENGEESRRFVSLVDPLVTIPARVVEITGITDGMVNGMPHFSAIAEELAAVIGDAPIVAHNAAFDASFLRAEYARCGKTTVSGQLRYIDTLELARKAFPGKRKYKLETLCVGLHISNLKQSHRAEADALCVAALFELCKRVLQHETTEQEIHANHEAYLQSLRIDVKSLKPTHPVNKKSPLYKRTFAFTGDFSMPREEIVQLTVDAGGIVRQNVSKTLDYLVKGVTNFSAVGASGVSSKERQALELIASGKSQIEIISEADFLALLGQYADASNQ